MASITRRRNKDGTASWIAQVRVTGYPTQTRSFRIRVQADLWASSTEIKARGGTLVIAQKMTLTELIEEVRPRLKSEFVAALTYWETELGHLHLRHIRPALIAQHRDTLLGAETCSHGHKTTKPRGATTVWHYLQALSRVFSVAERELHLVDFNPVSKVQRPSLPRGRLRFLSAAERESLLAACRASESRELLPLVLFMLTTGAGAGEAYSLTWDNIELDAQWAVFPKTKNGTARGVPLTPAVVNALSAMPRDEVRVFPRNVTRAWRTAMKRAMLKDFRMHDLRHSAASQLVQGGASLFEVGRLLGHKDVRMSDRYAHIANEQTSALVQRLMVDVK